MIPSLGAYERQLINVLSSSVFLSLLPTLSKSNGKMSFGEDEKKKGREPEQTALPRRHANDQQAYEKMLNFTTIREMELKTTVGYHLTPVGVTITNKTGRF